MLEPLCLLALSSALALRSGAVPSGPEPAPAALTAGAVIEREMAEGETHRYQVELRAGDYLHVLVDQRGIDVAASVRGPGGAVVLRTDCPCQAFGPEPIALVAAVDGTFEVWLEGVEAAAPPRARYELRVEALRAPIASDRLRAAAVRAGADAVQAKGKPREVLDHRRAALEHWRALADRRMVLWTQAEIGYGLAFDLDQAAQAETPYREALAAATELGDVWAEVKISDALAQVTMRRGRVEETRALMERALALSRAAGWPRQVARMLTVLGSFFSLTGEPQAALDRLYEALPTYQALGDARREAETRIELAATYLRIDEWELALQHYERALPAFAADPGRRARCITEIGVCRQKLDDHAGARRAYEEALAIYRTLENPIAEGDTLIGLADLHRDQDDLKAALDAASAALERYRSRTFPVGIAFAQCRLGDIYRRLGNASASRAAFQEIVAQGTGSLPGSMACAQRGMARLDAIAGDLESAQRHAESALQRVESLRSLASPLARTAALASRQSIYEVLVDILVRRHEREAQAGHDAAAYDMSERARARTLLDLLNEARVDVSRDIPAPLLASERAAREGLNKAAAAQARAERAGRAAEAEAHGRDVGRLSAELADVESRIRTAGPRYAALTRPQPLTLAESRQQVLDAETQILHYVLGEAQSYLFVVSVARLDIFRLPPRADIEAKARRLHRALSAAPGSGPASDASPATRELSAVVLAPAAGVLSARRLLVVAPGALQNVPFAALSAEGDRPLLDRFELVSAPSASVVATVRAQGPRGGSGGVTAVATFADPVFDSSDPRLARAARPQDTPALIAASESERGDPATAALRSIRGNLGRLPFSRREAEAIAALAGPRRSLTALGFEANRSAATSPRLADYGILHFATHAILNVRRPELSGVVLSLLDAGGRPQDGFLRLHDIYNLKLAAELVVLSGCQTGLGKDRGGEGLIGLTRGFMYAGAKAVVASLWQVDDESTAELMKRFYRGMLKEDRRPADALRQAQLEMSKDKRWSAPFYWAGFVLQGEWR